MRDAKLILTFRKLPKSHLLHVLTWFSHPSPSAAGLPVDEPVLASIMTHDHAKHFCASELSDIYLQPSSQGKAAWKGRPAWEGSAGLSGLSEARLSPPLIDVAQVSACIINSFLA